VCLPKMWNGMVLTLNPGIVSYFWHEWGRKTCLACRLNFRIKL